MIPVDKKFKVTLGYGVKSGAYVGGVHKGVDFGVPVGTPVVAMNDGVVTANHWGAAFGNHVVIAHIGFPDGTPGLWAGYMHLSSIKVKPGQRVKRGQIIGASGATGHVTGPHLHIEIQNSNGGWNALKSVDPQKWINC
jgi:murein DD-endopeptidase MepM/ murein hydrolase activator NlpD